MKKLLVFGLIVGMMFLTAGIVAAGNSQGPALDQLWDILGDSPMNGNADGQSEHLFLWQKNADWEIVGDNWGRLVFMDNEMFSFNAVIRYGENWNAGTDYTLIYYPDPWPGQGLICLGNGTTNEYGNVWFSGEFDFSTIPIAGDDNEQGAKIWLVLSDDVDCRNQVMTGWNPTEYLFENNLI